MRKLFLSIILMISFVAVQAQQDASYSMYMFNGLFVNPAYAGSKEVLALNAIYRHQWAKIEGAPRSFSIGAHTALPKDQYAVGLMMNHDQLGIRKFNSVYGSFAFRPKIKEKVRLSLGIQAGFSHFNPDQSSLLTNRPASGDNAFNQLETLWLPNVGFGIMTYSKRFYLGFSVPHILNNSLADKLSIEGSSDDIARQFQHYFATGGVVIGKELSRVKFKPSFLMKWVPNTPIDFDINLALLFVDRYWVGLSYRTGGDRANQNSLGIGESIIGMFEMKVTNQLAVGYAYDFPISRLNSVTSGTHEIFIGYEFGFNKKRFINPRYVNYF